MAGVQSHYLPLCEALGLDASWYGVPSTQKNGRGFRWIKNPAAIAPVWLEKPERIAALAMLTVVGLLVYSIIQRQVRLYLRTHDQPIPGNKGMPSTPTAAVVLALFSSVFMIQLGVDDQQIEQMSGVQSHHLLLWDALGLDSSWYGVPSTQKNGRGFQTP